MTFPELRKKEGRMSGLLALDRALSVGASSFLKKFLLIGLPFLMVAILSYEWWQFFPANVLYGLMFLDIAVLLIIFMLDCFYYSHYFAGMHTILSEWGIPARNSVLSYEVGEIVSHTSSADLTAGFLKAKAGKDILARLHIPHEIIKLFATSDRHTVYADPVSFSEPVDLCSYANALYEADKAFAHFLSEHGVTRSDFIGAAMWVSDMYEKRKEMFRWWGKDSLGRIKGIGKDWARTDSEVMKKFGYFAEPKDEESVYKKEINTLEKALSRSQGKKVLLIADEYRKLEAVLSGLAERISDGSVLPPLQHKRLLILDTVKLDEVAHAQGRFETFFGELFAEAILAGDIILVIKNLPFLVHAAKKRDIKLYDIIGPYLASNLIDIVGLSTKDAHSELIKPDKELSTHFDHISIETEDKKIILRALQHKAYEVEHKSRMFFTYQALNTLADIAIKSHGDHMAEYKALGLFIEIVPKLVKKGVKTVTVSDIIALAH